MTTFKELAQQRFSARKFTNAPVSKEDLDYIMECVRLAPSAVNKQPWKFVIIESEEAKQRIRQTYDKEWFATAPLYILCLKDEANAWTRRYDDKSHADIDLAIAIEHLCLAATDRGLGTCWVCNYRTEPMKQLFPYKEYEAVAIIPLGHIADDCPNPGKTRKEIADIWETI